MKTSKPKSTPTKRKANSKPPSWLSNKWNKAKAIGGAAVTLGTGVAIGSMIPFAASKDTETDIDRMRNH